MIKKIFGPPGTGKTTTLLDLVDTYIKKGTDLNRIGYFAFTRKAANEAKDRMLERNPDLDKKDLKYFQTLHSFAFHTLGMSEENVMQPVHYEQIGKELNLRVTEVADESGYLNFNSDYFKLINKARVKNISVEEEFNTNEWSDEVDYETLGHIYLNFNYFKQQNNLDDFNDMIKKFVDQKEKCKEFDVIFIDEAQDLSPIQWDMFDVFKEKSKDIYLAGDDDQAIFAWAGADVKRFLNEPAEEVVLPYSNRVPKNIQELSNVIVSRIQTRKDKKYYAKKGAPGSVEFIYNIEHIDLTKDNWLILTRTTYRSDEISKQLRENNLYFKSRFGKSYNTRLYKSVLNFSELCKGNKINIADAKELHEYLPDNPFFKFTDNKQYYSMDDFGYGKDALWYNLFTRADQGECFYIRTMLSNGDKLSQPPRIEVSTIHAAKGGECENVILVLDNARKIRQSVENNIEKADEEHRVWYVGSTRAKESLYLLKPKKERYGYSL